MSTLLAIQPSVPALLSNQPPVKIHNTFRLSLYINFTTNTLVLATNFFHCDLRHEFECVSMKIECTSNRTGWRKCLGACLASGLVRCQPDHILIFSRISVGYDLESGFPIELFSLYVSLTRQLLPPNHCLFRNEPWYVTLPSTYCAWCVAISIHA